MRGVLGGPVSGIGGYDVARIERAIAELKRPCAGAGKPDPYVVVARVTMAAVEHIPSVDHAGVALVGRKNVIRSLAATDGHPLVLDNIQRHCLQGPCYESAGDQVTRVTDLTVETRWPTFVERALAATPIRAILKFPLFANNATSAALYLYANRPGTLDEVVESAGVLFAEHAARALKAGQGRQRPIAVSAGGDIVDEATQMLVDRYHFDSGTALSILENLSTEHRQPIAVTARRLMGTGRISRPVNL